MEEDLLKKGQQTARAIAPPPFVEEDEINLLDLFRVVWRWKTVVLCAVFVGLAVPVAHYAFTPPTYRAVAFLLPPSNEEVQGFNAEGVNENGEPDYFAGNVYTAFIQRLSSQELRQKYIKERGASGIKPSDFSIERVGDEVLFGFQGKDAKQAAGWVNGYIGLAREETTRALMAGEDSKYRGIVKRLRDKVAAMRNKARHEREKRIAELEEAAYVAEKLGIKENVVATSGRVVVIANPSGLPLYMEGSKVLRARVEVLRERKNGDLFIPGMDKIQNRLARLKGFNPEVNLSHVSVVRVKRAATVPNAPLSKSFNPRSLVVGMLGGLVFGMFAAFFTDFVSRVRKKSPVEI